PARTCKEPSTSRPHLAHPYGEVVSELGHDLEPPLEKRRFARDAAQDRLPTGREPEAQRPRRRERRALALDRAIEPERVEIESRGQPLRESTDGKAAHARDPVLGHLGDGTFGTEDGGIRAIEREAGRGAATSARLVVLRDHVRLRPQAEPAA